MQLDRHKGMAKGRSRGAIAKAFTLIELMLAIAIMGVIIYALYHVFNQTQRALRSNEVQGDISEKARAIMDLVSREIEQSQPTFGSVNGFQEDNMVGGPEFLPLRSQKSADRGDIQPRTNALYNIFFLNNRTNAWQGIGYRILNYTNGVGSLERFETNLFGHRPASNIMASTFINEPLTSTNYHHIADGVIHFKVVPFDENGYRLGFDTTNRVAEHYTIIRIDANGAVNKNTNYSDTTIVTNANVVLQGAFVNVPEETRYAFKSNALPAYMDLELGMLEPDTLKQYNQMLQDQNPNATNFLSRQINKVHLFRERIPIRTAAQ